MQRQLLRAPPPLIPPNRLIHCKEERKLTKIKLSIEELEQRIAPSIAPGLRGYEGQPGYQGNHGGNNGNPSGSANTEVPAGNNPQPNGN
jgi:hypothetical protein